jgi:hypothetical protein
MERIRIDGGTQPRAAISESVVSEYADALHAGVTLPPIDLFFDGVEYWLADGFHRYHAAMQLGVDRIDSELHIGTRREAVLFSVSANQSHGLRRTNEDKRKAVMTLVEDSEWGAWSGREIARRCGVDQSYANKLKAEFATSLSLKDSERTYKTKRGTEATMNVENIGRKGPARTREAVKQRKDQMREMAGKGYTSRQIAAALALSEEGCRATLKQAGIDVPADRSTRGLHKHDSTRILEHMVMDAEHLTADVGLIDFADLDASRISEWLKSLKSSRDKLGEFIRRLMKEQQKHGEAA